MKSKLNFLIGVSLKRKIKTKWFIVANILLFIVIAGIINIDHVINFFGGEFDKIQKLYVIDNTNISYELFKNQIDLTEKNILNDDDKESYDVIKYNKSKDDALKEIKKDDGFIIIFTDDVDNTISATLISNGYIDTIDYQIISSAINNTKVTLAINASNISPDELNKIYSAVDIKREILDESKKTEDESMNMIMTTVFPFLILPFFALSLFLVQMIGAEVNDEKTTRGMEIIISNVSPKTHFFAKVIAGNLFVLIQGITLFIYALLGLLIRKIIGGGTIMNGALSDAKEMLDNALSSGIGDKLIYIIPIALLLMVLTFIAYSLLAGVLASMTTNIEDFQQLQTPIMVISLVGYYLSIMAGVFNGSLFIKIFSYIPFISAILTPSLLMLGQIGIIDIGISLVLIIITIYLLIKYGLRIYKVGILNYSSKNLWKKMFQAMKN